MKLKYVEDAIVEQAKTHGRRNVHDWAPIIEELYANPNRWVEAPFKVSFPNTAYKVRDKYAGIEVVCTGGNMLATTHDNKQNWTVYLKFAQSEQTLEADKELF